MSLYPFRFRPLFRRYLWGGRRLATELHKPLPAGNDFAESWELVDHGNDQSVVANGPLAGLTLAELVKNYGKELLGRHHPQPRFPLLFKYLDCNQNLSVQVHPTDSAAALLDPPDLGKTEAWLILAARPGSLLYAGLKRGFDRPALEREVARGTTELCLHKMEPQPGDCIFVPAGAIHALGAGLLVAEIQQASDTTYRLFDWNRTGADGQPRELHIEAGLSATNFDLGPLGPQQPEKLADGGQRLVACDKFILDRRQTIATANVGGDDRFHIVSVLSGAASFSDGEEPLTLGQTLLIPASVGTVPLRAQPDCTWIDMYLP